MIPDITKNVLTNGFGHLGSVNKKNLPVHLDTLGQTFDNEKNTITCFTIEKSSNVLLENLYETKRVSFYIGMASHEAYQFKGEFINSHNMSTLENNISAKYCKSCIEILKNFGMTDEFVNNSYGKMPNIGITFKIEKIFVQTPGPSAGTEIDFKG